jgi:hypothetical protein
MRVKGFCQEVSTRMWIFDSSLQINEWLSRCVPSSHFSFRVVSPSCVSVMFLVLRACLVRVFSFHDQRENTH